MDYISRADQNALNARYKFTAFIVVVFGVTVVTYVLIGRIVTLTSARRPPNPLREGFYYTALVVGLGTVVLRRVLLSRAQVGKLVRRGVGAVLGRLSTTSIICAALGELVGILSMVATIMTGDTGFTWGVGGASLALVAYSFPRRFEWARLVAVASQQTGGEQTAPATGSL
ncbi:MAG TPA: hypothetical protein VFD58_20705 [Blastocatellia bacterium]|nr:hypothetical protein [Blastocatellia bacterium]